MTGRERQLAALRHEIADRIPLDAICVENAGEIAAALGLAPEAVADRLGLDGRIIGPGYAGEAATLPDGTLLNPWGTPDTGDYGTTKWNPLADADGVAAVERYRWPDPEAFTVDSAAAAARALGRTSALRGPYWLPVFCRVCDLFGMEEAMARLLTEPAVFEAAMARVTDIVAAVIARFLDACGDDLPILCLGDDFATQRGLLIDPAHWRRAVKPHLARLFALGKARGKFVWFHSCGDITAILPDLLDLGVDLWETVQLHTLPCSAADLKRDYGRHLAFFGGINTQRLPFATPQDVRDETRRCIEALGRDGGYICGPDHHIKPEVPVANTLALFDTARAFRAAGYTR